MIRIFRRRSRAFRDIPASWPGMYSASPTAPFTKEVVEAHYELAIVDDQVVRRLPEALCLQDIVDSRIDPDQDFYWNAKP